MDFTIHTGGKSQDRGPQMTRMERSRFINESIAEMRDCIERIDENLLHHSQEMTNLSIFEMLKNIERFVIDFRNERDPEMRAHLNELIDNTEAFRVQITASLQRYNAIVENIEKSLLEKAGKEELSESEYFDVTVHHDHNSKFVIDAQIIDSESPFMPLAAMLLEYAEVVK